MSFISKPGDVVATQTLKLKRRAVLTKWQSTIDAIYSKKKSKEGASATA